MIVIDIIIYGLGIVSAIAITCAAVAELVCFIQRRLGNRREVDERLLRSERDIHELFRVQREIISSLKATAEAVDKHTGEIGELKGSEE